MLGKDSTLNSNMDCHIKVETEESAQEYKNGFAMCAPSDQITEIKIKEEYDEIADSGVNDVLHSGELSCNDIKMEIDAPDDEKVTEEWLDKRNRPIKEEKVESDTEVKNDKDLNEFLDRPNTSSISILKGLLIQKENNSSVSKEHENETALLSNSEQNNLLDEENVADESTAVEKFRVNMSAIESVSKENQVSC